MSKALHFPMVVVVRSRYLDQVTREIATPANMQWVNITVVGTECFPIFTLLGYAIEFITSR